MAKSVGPESPGRPPEALLRALQTLLRPLVRGLVARGVTLPYLAEMLKTIYVDVASTDFRRQGAKQTQSRISLLSGVHRKDVKRLRDASPTQVSATRVAPFGARLVGIWAGVSEYLDENGRPRPLPYQGSTPDELSFDSLVQSVSKDVRSRSVLDEWLRLGIATQSADGLIRLNVRAFVPHDDFDETAYFFGRNVRDHIAAAIRNLLREGHPLLERAVFYDRLSPESVDRLETLARKLGEEALLEVNREALKLADQDENRDDAAMRMTFGVYFYGTDEQDDRGEDDDDTD